MVVVDPKASNDPAPPGLKNRLILVAAQPVAEEPLGRASAPQPACCHLHRHSGGTTGRRGVADASRVAPTASAGTGGWLSQAKLVEVVESLAPVSPC